MDKKKVYLASPLGFNEIGRKFYYQELIPMLESSGLRVLDPWKSTPPATIHSVQNMPYGQEKKEAWEKLNKEIGENNRKYLDDCDCILAVLDGIDVDSGTASEIGYGFAVGKLIVGYRGDFRLSSDNEGSIVNIQVEYFIRKSGGDIVADIGNAIELIKTT